MCEIDHARPKIENLQTTEKSQGWLGFWWNLDQTNRSDASCLMRNFRTIETNKQFPKNSKNFRTYFRKSLKIDIADVINYWETPLQETTNIHNSVNGLLPWHLFSVVEQRRPQPPWHTLNALIIVPRPNYAYRLNYAYRALIMRTGRRLNYAYRAAA